MHFALLLDFERWRLYTEHGRGRVQWMVGIGLNVVGARPSVSSSVGVWANHSTEVQLQEASVYLLLWGEAGNIRFMPELLYFLVELAIQHVRNPEAPEEAEAGSYLQRLILPIYTELFNETFTGLVKGRPNSKSAAQLRRYPRNYDDWNEAFWDLDSIASKVLTTDGSSIMATAPHQRWALLRDQADWKAFFAAVPKTHREVRWWTNMVVGNRRVFLCALGLRLELGLGLGLQG